FSLDKLHDVKGSMPIAARGIQANDVRVTEFLEKIAFALKASQSGRIRIEAGAHDFHRHGLIRLALEAVVDRAHGPMPDFLVDDERPNSLAHQHAATPIEAQIPDLILYDSA